MQIVTIRLSTVYPHGDFPIRFRGHRSESPADRVDPSQGSVHQLTQGGESWTQPFIGIAIQANDYRFGFVVIPPLEFGALSSRNETLGMLTLERHWIVHGIGRIPGVSHRSMPVAARQTVAQLMLVPPARHSLSVAVSRH